ncbi:MAG: MFS transporter [bacterium]
MKRLLFPEFVQNKELNQSLNFVILGICFGVVFLNVTTGTPIAGLAKELRFGDLLYGVMLAMPVLGGTVQIFASFVLEKTRERKRLFILSGFINRALWIFVATLPLFISNRILLFYLLVSILVFSSIGGAFLNVTFMSWMGDLVPLDIRGRFFSYRSMVSTIVSFISGLIIGKFLDTVPGILGFSIIFGIATLFGILDILCYSKVNDPPMKFSNNPRENIFDTFREVLSHSYFSKYLFFSIAWSFSLNIAAPYFNLYMIKYLRMSYFEIALYAQLVSNLATVIFVRVWGKMIDRFGNKPVAIICTTIVSFLPMLWCFTSPQSWLFLIILIQLLAGLFWPGVDLTYNNFALSLSPNENRSMYIAVLNFFVGIIGNAMAYIIGGYFIENISPLISSLLENTIHFHLSNYHYLFILSSILRLLSSRVFLPKIKEEGAYSIDDLRRSFIRKAPPI